LGFLDDDPGAGTNAANADHLGDSVDAAVAVEQD